MLDKLENHVKVAAAAAAAVAAYMYGVALGINPIPVYADGITCAVAVAFDGNRAWIMESPGETAAIRIVPRDSLTVRYSTKSGSSTPRATPRACWRDT